MTDETVVPDAATATRCPLHGSERRRVTDVEDEEQECTDGTRLIPSVEELEEVLHSAARSCRHCDEVWPHLYLGDM